MTSTPAEPFSLTQTLGLLDCADTVRQRDLGRGASTPPDPTALRQHLQAVCAQMDRPMSDTQLDQAVSLYLQPAASSTESTPALPAAAPAAPAPSAPASGLLADRPAHAQAWRDRMDQVQGQIRARKSELYRLKDLVFHVGGGAVAILVTIGVVALFLKIMASTSPGGPLDHWPLFAVMTGCFGTGGLAMLLTETPGFKARLSKMEDQIQAAQKDLEALQAVPADRRPTEAELKNWLQVPGAAAAFLQIHASDVPLLEQDCQTFRTALANHQTALARVKIQEAAAKHERIAELELQAWQAQFKTLAEAHLTGVTGGVPA